MLCLTACWQRTEGRNERETWDWVSARENGLWSWWSALGLLSMTARVPRTHCGIDALDSSRLLSCCLREREHSRTHTHFLPLPAFQHRRLQMSCCYLHWLFIPEVCVPCSVYVAHVCPCAFYKAIYNVLKLHLPSIYKYYYRDSSTKNESSVIISSPWYCSKPVWLYFICGTQKNRCFDNDDILRMCVFFLFFFMSGSQ